MSDELIRSPPNSEPGQGSRVPELSTDVRGIAFSAKLVPCNMTNVVNVGFSPKTRGTGSNNKLPTSTLVTVGAGLYMASGKPLSKCVTANVGSGFFTVISAIRAIANCACGTAATTWVELT